MGRGAGILSQESKTVEGRGHTSASAPGCGFILLSLQAVLKEAGNSRGWFQFFPELLWGEWDVGRELISAYRPENNWQLHMSLRNKNEKSIIALFNQCSLVETAPKFLGRNSVDRKASPVTTKLGCVEGGRDI